MRGRTLGALSCAFLACATPSAAQSAGVDAAGSAPAETRAAPEDGAARAQQLFDAGVSDMLAARYDRGCSLINESQRVDPKAGTLFTLAECYARAGKAATAARTYALYLTSYELMSTEQSRAHAERAAIARAQRNKLSRLAPRLEITWAGTAPADAEVTLDGTALSPSQLGRPQTVDPGEHVIVVRYPDGSLNERRLSVELGQSGRAVLPVPRSTASRAPAARDARLPPNSRRTWTYIVGGAGLTGLLVGSVTGIMVLDYKKDVDEHCTTVSKNRAECDAQGLDASRSASKYGAVSTVAFAAGAAGIISAITLLLTEPRASSSQQQGAWRVDVAGSRSSGQFTLKKTF